MSLSSVFELARAIELEPHLIEIGRSAVGAPDTTSYYLWSSETLAAAITARGVRIQHALDGSAAIELDATELEWLVEVCADWRRRRDEWGAFWPTSSPPHAMGRRIDHYQEPGARRRVRSVPRDPAAAVEWSGREVVRRCAVVDVARDAQVVAELWHEGVHVGGPDRVLVGVRYRGRTLRVDARRREVLIAHPRRRDGLRLLAREEGILAALRRCRR